MSTWGGGGGGGGGSLYIRSRIISKLEGYHENFGQYYDSYGGYYDSYGEYHDSYRGYHLYIGDWELFSSLGSSLALNIYYIYIDTSDALNIPRSTDESPTLELWYPPR